MAIGGQIRAAATLTFLARVGTNINGGLRAFMERVGIMLQAYVLTQKLSGQALNRRTGKLAGSVNQRVEESNGTFAAIVQAGNLAPYGAIHEFGGLVTIPDHLSASRLGRSYLVRSHTANYPQRSFMRSSLAENQEQILQMAEKMVTDSLKGKP